MEEVLQDVLFFVVPPLINVFVQETGMAKDHMEELQVSPFDTDTPIESPPVLEGRS